MHTLGNTAFDYKKHFQPVFVSKIIQILFKLLKNIKFYLAQLLVHLFFKHLNHFTVPMKFTTTEGSRKQGQQKASLLKTRKSSIQQQKIKSASVAIKQGSNKIYTSTGFAESDFYDNNKFIIANEAYLIKNNHHHYKRAGLQPRRNVVYELDSAIYDNASHCTECLNKSLEISQHRQEQRSKQIRMANKACISRQQKHALIYQFQKKFAHIDYTTTQRNRDNYVKQIPARKHARLSDSTDNFQQPIPLITTEFKKAASYDNNFHQQIVKLQQQSNSVHQVDKFTTRQYTVNQQYMLSQKNTNFHDYYNHHFDPFSTNQDPRGSLTSSVESVGSDTSEITTSQYFGNTFLLSQQLQINNNANVYNVVHQ